MNNNGFLEVYRNKIELAISKNLPYFGPQGKLLDVCSYALSTGGKRFRPSLTLIVADALGLGSDTMLSALAVEFFHTASLVADDLPSMDDDDERRNMPSVHKKFGEGAALLVSYALIAAGYECIAKNTEVIKRSGLSFSDQADARGILALQNAAFNTGLNGATGGQYLDLAPSSLSLQNLKEIIQKKSSSLFEISLVFGWLFGGGDPHSLPSVKQAASHFGLAFQIADDLGDQEQDIKNGRDVNMANVFGKERAIEMFHVEHNAFLLKCKELRILSPAIEEAFQKIYPLE